MAISRIVTRETLAPLPLFAGVDQAALGELAAASRIRQARAHEAIARQGEVAEIVILVLSGQVRLLRYGDEGHESILGILGPGALVGDAALLDEDAPFLDGGVYAVTVSAQGACEYLAIRAAAMARLLRTNAPLAFNVARLLARRMRMLIVRDSWMRSLDLPMRLARFLVWLAEGGAGQGDPGRPSLRASQEQLGQLIGGTRESVNKHLRQWTREGIVEQADGRLIVLDLERLRKIADAPPEALSFEKINAL